VINTIDLDNHEIFLLPESSQSLGSSSRDVDPEIFVKVEPCSGMGLKRA